LILHSGRVECQCVMMLVLLIEWHWLSPSTRFPPSFSEQPRTQLAYKLGDLVVLDCRAEAYPPAQ